MQGYKSLFTDGVIPFLRHIILPTITLSVIFIALIARMTRASAMEVLQEDYARTAWAKGQNEMKLVLRHALRNAAVPIVTVVGLGIALLMRHPSIVWGGALLAVMVIIALFGPFFIADPVAPNPTNRLKSPSMNNWFGTDFLGRDVFSRVICGARISLVVGLAVSIVAVSLGLFAGLLADYVRILDAVLMRVMDG